MQLHSKALAGKEMNFTSSVYDHASFRFVIDEEGVVRLLTRDVVTLSDDKGNVLTVVEVYQGPGEPVLQAFAFDGDIPEEYAEFVFDYRGQDLVPSRYVHGVTGVKELTDEIPDDLAQEILDDAGIGGFFLGVEPDVEAEDETN